MDVSPQTFAIRLVKVPYVDKVFTLPTSSMLYNARVPLKNLGAKLKLEILSIPATGIMD